MVFERTQSSFVENKVRDQIEEQRIGTVISVYEHLEVGDGSNFEVDVETDAGRRIERVAPILQNGSGQIDVPKVGDSVLVGFRAGKEQEPIVMGYAYTSTDRPPLGKAGMSRQKFESQDSPAGTGDLFVTGYTKYSSDVADINKDIAFPVESLVRIAKRDETGSPDPTEESDIPAKIEMYDRPLPGDESYITVELNRVDGEVSDATWGIKFNIKTGEWKLVGPTGFGITSDGDGNFVWNHKSIDFNETETGNLSL